MVLSFCLCLGCWDCHFVDVSSFCACYLVVCLLILGLESAVR